MIFDHFVPQLKDCSTHAKQVSVNSCKARNVQLVYDRNYVCVIWIYLILLYTKFNCLAVSARL